MINTTARWSKKMYDQVKKYADDNEMGFMEAVRYIIREFFKKQ